MATRKLQTARKSPTPTKTRSTAKPVAKSAAKSTAKPVAKPPVKTDSGKPSAKDKPSKDMKARKPKMVRDSFTMPKGEYAAIDTLKARATQAGRPAKKSELLRAGVKLLEGLSPADLMAALHALPAIKTGRPAKT